MEDEQVIDWFSRRVAPALRCDDCGALSDPDARGWRCYRAGEAAPEHASELLFLCSRCSETV